MTKCGMDLVTKCGMDLVTKCGIFSVTTDFVELLTFFHISPTGLNLRRVIVFGSGDGDGTTTSEDSLAQVTETIQHRTSNGRYSMLAGN